VPNSQGVLVVEVDKVCRDLKMLFKTFRHSKFYKILAASNENEQELNNSEDEEE